MGKNRWVVVTRDERIRYRVAEKQAIRRAKVRAFVIVAHGDLRIEEVAEILLKALSKIQSIAAQEKPPFIAKVWRDGNVAVIPCSCFVSVRLRERRVGVCLDRTRSGVESICS